jgi:DNA repair exonuclease SbcCD nuclease subunit
VDALMRIAHVADTHLGFQRWGYPDEDGFNQRESDVYKVFNEAIGQMIERNVDVVIHAGDMFDSHHPPTRAIEVALDGFERLKQAGIPVVAVPGNHSTPRGPMSAHVFGLLERFGVQTISGAPGRVRVGELTVTGIPHHHQPETLREQIRAVRPDPDATFNVLVLHVGTEGLAGAGDRETAPVELEPEILNEGAEFTYMALGHLHSHDRPTRNASYSGSLERLTFGDKASRKGWVEVDLAAPGQPGFLHLHEVEPRSFLQREPIDATDCDDLLPLLEGALEGHTLEGAMIRIPLVGVDRGLWRSFDRTTWARRTAEALHVELVPEYASSGPSPAAFTPELSEFLRSHVPKGIDADEIVRRADDFVRQAAERLPDA